MNSEISFLRSLGWLFAVGVMVLGAVDASPASAQENLAGDPVRGAEMAEPCLSCHGADGMGYSDGIPRIVGQTDTYIRAQVKLFRQSARLRTGGPDGQNGDGVSHLKSRARSFSGMDDFVLELTDQDIADISSYLTTLKCKPSAKQQTVTPAVATRCESCHKQGGAIATKTVPSLASQHAIYLRRQLKFFRTAKNLEDVDLKAEGTARFSKIMFTHARRLTDEQIRELSIYYESVPCK